MSTEILYPQFPHEGWDWLVDQGEIEHICFYPQFWVDIVDFQFFGGDNHFLFDFFLLVSLKGFVDRVIVDF